MIGAFLEATIKEALKHQKEADAPLAIAIQSQTPPDREHVRDRRIAWCRSLLEMRDHLAAPDPGNLVIVTPLEDQELADDIRARIRRHKLIPINVKEMLKHAYEAREVDSRVTADAALCAALLRCTPVPVSGGILHEEAAWQTVCPEVFGLGAARPDAVGLLEWITGTPAFFDGPQGIRRLTPLAQRLHTDFATEPRFDNPRAPQVRLRGFDLDSLGEVGRKVRDIYASGSSAPGRISTLCDDPYILTLATAVSGSLGGKVGVAPRLFLKKLVSDVLDRVDQFPDFDPRRHYELTLSSAEMTDAERGASVDDIELPL